MINDYNFFAFKFLWETTISTKNEKSFQEVHNPLYCNNRINISY